MVEKVRQLHHRRIPVYRENRDTLVGMIHAENLMRMALDDVDISLLAPEDILQPVIMVPPTKKVDEMFEFFLKNNAQAAVVLNEFGGIDGLVTLKRVINFIFGHTSGDEPLLDMFEESVPGVFEVAGDIKLTDFNIITNFGLQDNRMTTISGVMLRHLDRLPAVGDEVVVEGVRLQVLAVEGHRITRVRAMSVTEKSNTIISEVDRQAPEESKLDEIENEKPGEVDEK
jgi:CBS domain containing-hemolysin-like protein